MIIKDQDVKKVIWLHSVFFEVSNIDNIFSTQLCANRNVDEAVNVLDREYVFVGQDLLVPIVNCVRQHRLVRREETERNRRNKMRSVKPRRCFLRREKGEYFVFIFTPSFIS